MNKKTLLIILVLTLFLISACKVKETVPEILGGDQIPIKPEDECQNIEVTSSRDDCYRRIATSKQDTELCNKISDFSLIDHCIGLIASAKNSIKTCESSHSKTGYNDECLYWLGMDTNNKSICRTIDSGHLEIECLRSVAKATKDPEICRGLPEDTLTRKFCFEDIGVTEE